MDLSKLDIDTYQQLLKTDLKQFGTYIDKFTNRVFTVSKASLGIERQLLHKWKKYELLPFRTIDSENKNWNRFSFIELCWLKVLLSLREQGIGLERLKHIKGFLFPTDFGDVLLKHLSVEDLHKYAPAALDEKEGIVKDNKIVPIEITKSSLEKSQASPFMILIFQTIFLGAKTILYITEDGTPDVIDLNEIEQRPLEGIKRALDIFDNASLTSVNIKKITDELLKLHEKHFN